MAASIVDGDVRMPSDLAEWLEMDEDIEFEIDPVGLDIRPANV